MKGFRTGFLFIGPMAFVLSIGLSIGAGLGKEVIMLGLLCWMLIWWSSQVVPIAVTSLLPILIFPLTGIGDLKTTVSNYSNPVIFLFFGGFVLGIAIEKWQLHRRIALNIIRISGLTPRRIILGAMISTAFLSMWISNTATTLMMLPIGLSIISLISIESSDQKRIYFQTALLLGIAYSANIGGMATLIGTPPNLVLAGMAADTLGKEIGFLEWIYFAFPLVGILLVLVFILNAWFLFPLKGIKLTGLAELLKKELSMLGSPGTGERRVIAVFALTAIAWILRPQINRLAGLENLSDHMIAIGSSILLFIIPDGRSQTLMRWRDAQRIPWEILLLFGGGLAVAQGMSKTGVMDNIGDFIGSNFGIGLLGMIILVTTISVFMTEIMSNVALVSVFIPIAFGIAIGLNMEGLTLAIPITLGASCAFMFPISTPPNAIVFSSRRISMIQMARAGLILNVITILTISLYYWIIYQD